jgi:hypothetical protein
MATRGNDLFLSLISGMKGFHLQIKTMSEIEILNKLRNKCQAAETNREGTRNSEVIVRTTPKGVERGLTRLSAIQIYGQKPVIGLVSNSARTAINEDPVLNQFAARLGQSLRETEDELMRTMLEGTAGFLNCVGGVNARNVGVLKSDLIDLELQAA